MNDVKRLKRILSEASEKQLLKPNYTSEIFSSVMNTANTILGELDNARYLGLTANTIEVVCPNTARLYLAILEDLGLVCSSYESRVFSSKAVKVYRLSTYHLD